jgi:ABC-type amino acid transport substrate-binding protein
VTRRTKSPECNPLGRHGTHSVLRRAAWLLAAAWVASCAAAQTAATAPATLQRALPTEAREWKGDFDGMLVPYSRTLFYNDKGRERGVSAETARAFEQHLDRKDAAGLGKRPITLFLVPSTRDELLQGVVVGLGDIAAGNLTVTEGRKQLVDFAAPADAKPDRRSCSTGRRPNRWPRPRRCRA